MADKAIVMDKIQNFYKDVSQGTNVCLKMRLGMQGQTQTIQAAKNTFVAKIFEDNNLSLYAIYFQYFGKSKTWRFQDFKVINKSFKTLQNSWRTLCPLKSHGFPDKKQKTRHVTERYKVDEKHYIGHDTATIAASFVSVNCLTPLFFEKRFFLTTFSKRSCRVRKSYCKETFYKAHCKRWRIALTARWRLIRINQSFLWTK